MSTNFYFSLVFLAFIFSGCMSTNKTLKSEKKKESYSYDYTENGCNTGNHAFSELVQYCKALQDDNLNNGCASSMRQRAYTNECKNLLNNSPYNDGSEGTTKPNDGETNPTTGNQSPIEAQVRTYYWYERCISGVRSNGSSSVAVPQYSVTFSCSSINSSSSLSAATAGQSDNHESKCPKTFKLIGPLGSSCTFSTGFKNVLISNIKADVDQLKSTDAPKCLPQTSVSLSLFGNLTCN